MELEWEFIYNEGRGISELNKEETEKTYENYTTSIPDYPKVIDYFHISKNLMILQMKKIEIGLDLTKETKKFDNNWFIFDSILILIVQI